MFGNFAVPFLLSRLYSSARLLVILVFPFSLLSQELPASNNKESYYLEEIFAKVPDPREATIAFYKTLEELNSPATDNEEKVARLYRDITDIIDDADSQRWKGLQTSDEKIAFLKHFWIREDLTPATEVNERLVEHYTRLLHARDWYSWFDKRGYDDRGQIYVQYGPPDDYVEDVVPSGAVPVTSWVYHRLGASVSFDFVDRGLGYRLTGRLDDAVMMPSSLTPLSYIWALEDLLRRRVDLNPSYTQLYWSLSGIFETARLRPDSVLPAFHGMRRQIERSLGEFSQRVSIDQAELPKTVSDILTGVDDLPCALNLAQFEAKDHELDLVAIYGIKTGDLKGKADTVRVQFLGTIRDTMLTICTTWDTTYEFTARRAAESGEFARAVTHSLPVAKYYYLLDITNASGNQRGMHDFSFILGTYPDGVLHLSSLIFSRNIVPAHEAPADGQFLRRHNLAILPYPFTAIKRRLPMFVYLEIYDLKGDESGETFYEVEYEVKAASKKGFTSLLASLNPFGKSPGSITLSDTRRGRAAVEPTYLQLDFSQLGTGKYDLIVRVTDKWANITKESKLEFELK